MENVYELYSSYLDIRNKIKSTVKETLDYINNKFVDIRIGFDYFGELYIFLDNLDISNQDFYGEYSQDYKTDNKIISDINVTKHIFKASDFEVLEYGYYDLEKNLELKSTLAELYEDLKEFRMLNQEYSSHCFGLFFIEDDFKLDEL